jgi:DNA end-binding protein Ku
MRSIWSGAISFGLVNIPVNLYTATQRKRPSFRMLRKQDLCPIRYVRICERDKNEVPFQEIVKGVEYDKDYYVILDESDFKRADPEKSRIIKIINFADEGQIDPLLYEKPYYLEPTNTAGKAFSLFAKALKETKKVAIGQFVLRSKESLVTIRPKDKILVLDEIRFSDEIMDSSNLNSQEKADYSKDELEVAKDLINQMSKAFDLKEYKDTYSEKLKKVIEEKASGKVPAEKIEEAPVTETFDLMEKLKESLEKTKHGR